MAIYLNGTPITEENAVHKTTNETVSGVKNFTDGIKINEKFSIQYNETTESLDFIYS